MITLVDVYETRNWEFLYRLLDERKSWQSISHKEMPTFEDHVKFVNSKPYKHWYLVKRNLSEEYIGAVYISKYNEIGIFLLEKHTYKGFGKIILETLFEKHKEIPMFYANVAPLNSMSLAFFANNGFKHFRPTLDKEENYIVQYTFLKLNPCFENEHESISAEESILPPD